MSYRLESNKKLAVLQAIMLSTQLSAGTPAEGVREQYAR